MLLLLLLLLFMFTSWNSKKSEVTMS